MPAGISLLGDGFGSQFSKSVELALFNLGLHRYLQVHLWGIWVQKKLTLCSSTLVYHHSINRDNKEFIESIHLCLTYLRKETDFRHKTHIALLLTNTPRQQL